MRPPVPTALDAQLAFDSPSPLPPPPLPPPPHETLKADINTVVRTSKMKLSYEPELVIFLLNRKDRKFEMNEGNKEELNFVPSSLTSARLD
nr:hypothetical transcript [Hymenolepis microstoma]